MRAGVFPDAEGNRDTTTPVGILWSGQGVAATGHDEAGTLHPDWRRAGRRRRALWLCDRKIDLIISGGCNIYPADIERVLQGHPVVL
jgi:acyl-CoA synthetase (AMP-forming)/AMP-acid ligase II